MKRRDSLWVVVHIAHTKKRSEAVIELLTEEGFLVRARIIDRAFDSGEDCYEILALKSEAKEARDILRERGY